MPSEAVEVALITGAGRGIGAAIAVELAAAGMDVAIASIESEEDAAATLDAIRRAGRKVLYRQFDVSHIDDHRQLLEQTRAELGSVTCLVNNAGVTSLRRGDILDLSLESFDRALGINLRGTFFLQDGCEKKHMQRLWALVDRLSQLSGRKSSTG